MAHNPEIWRIKWLKNLKFGSIKMSLKMFQINNPELQTPNSELPNGWYRVRFEVEKNIEYIILGRRWEIGGGY